MNLYLHVSASGTLSSHYSMGDPNEGPLGTGRWFRVLGYDQAINPSGLVPGTADAHVQQWIKGAWQAANIASVGTKCCGGVAPAGEGSEAPWSPPRGLPGDPPHRPAAPEAPPAAQETREGGPTGSSSSAPAETAQPGPAQEVSPGGAV